MHGCTAEATNNLLDEQGAMYVPQSTQTSSIKNHTHGQMNEAHIRSCIHKDVPTIDPETTIASESDITLHHMSVSQ